MERRRQVSSRQEAEGPGPGSPEFYSVSRKLVLPAIPLGGLLPRAFSAPSLCLGCAPSVAPRPPQLRGAAASWPADRPFTD